MNNWLKKPLVPVIAAMLVFAGAAAMAGDGANKDEAVAMVKKAVAFIKEQSADKAYPDIHRQGPPSSSIATFTSSSISSTARCWPTARTQSSSART